MRKVFLVLATILPWLCAEVVEADGRCRERFSAAEEFWRQLGFKFDSCAPGDWSILKGDYNHECLLLNPSLNFSYRKRTEFYREVEWITQSALGFHRLSPRSGSILKEIPVEGFNISNSNEIDLKLWIDNKPINIGNTDKFIMRGFGKNLTLDLIITGMPGEFEVDLAEGHILAIRLSSANKEDLWVFGLIGSLEGTQYLNACMGLNE